MQEQHINHCISQVAIFMRAHRSTDQHCIHFFLSFTRIAHSVISEVKVDAEHCVMRAQCNAIDHRQGVCLHVCDAQHSVSYTHTHRITHMHPFIHLYCSSPAQRCALHCHSQRTVTAHCALSVAPHVCHVMHTHTQHNRLVLVMWCGRSMRVNTRLPCQAMCDCE